MAVRPVLLVFLAALTFSACGAPAPAPRPVTSAAPASGAQVLAVADAIVDDQFAESPDLETRLRPPGARYDHLPGDSLADFAAREAREDEWRATLASVDRSALGSTPAGLAYDIANETLAARKQARVCRYELWSVRQMGGFQVQFADLAQSQPVGTPELRAQALARFAKVPSYVTTQIANLREGLRLGYAQNDGNVKQVIDQLDRLTAGSPEESPFFGPAASDPEPAFRAKWKALVDNELTPSLTKYRDFLRDEYLPRARKAFGVSANPSGAECYRASIRLYTTVPMDAKAIHDSGLTELAHLEQEMTALSAKSFGGVDVRALLERFAHDPAYLHKDAADVTALATASVTRAQAALPRAFGILPTAAVVIDPIPKYQERTAAAHYRPAALDGSQPAAYRIRLYEPEKTSVVLGESTAFHETIPGHHLQINIANSRAENPRIARFLFNAGFGEGWALYAERLADELGLYSNDASRMGMLSNAAWRACRLIVDSGLHAFGWSRDRAIALMLEHTAMSPAQAAQEVDRYISWPGQATAYMTGYLEIARLRTEAEKALGARFDRKQFHDRVLENGAVPLPVLRKRIEAWIAASR
ncbi:MAG: hypothetical protein JWP87_4167 [Labilithrix sp.]|nr:hypothetical protein [Labilithrix sp.]